MSPKISVVLPVYNDEKYIGAAIESILNQSFSDFELIVIDDRSTDKTAEVVGKFKDERIRFYINDKNLGRAGSDNFALSLVRGEYIAKMDSDDICHPERFRRQVTFLDQNSDINVVGSWMQNFGNSNYLNEYPASPEVARAMTLFTLPVGNPSIMLRTSLFAERGFRYDEKLRQTEDFDFFARYIKQLKIVSLPEALIKYRTYPDNAKKEVLTERQHMANNVRQTIFSKWGLEVSNKDLQIHHMISHLDVANNPFTLAEIEEWLYKIADYNMINPLFEQNALFHYLAVRWFEVCYTYPERKLASVKQYYKSNFSKYFSPTSKLKLKFLYKGIKHY